MFSINDLALKAKADGGADLKAQDVEDTLRAICAHRASAPGDRTVSTCSAISRVTAGFARRAGADCFARRA